MTLLSPGALRRLAAAVLMLAASLSPAAWAHEGHDHGAPAGVPTQAAAPRLATHSEAYELVGILRDGRLVLYLDRYATNEPVPDATLAVTLGNEEVQASPQPDGTYVVRSPALAGFGPLEVIAAVSHPSGDDLLIGTLDRPAAAAAPPPVAARPLDAFLAQAPRVQVGAASVPQPVAIAAVSLALGLMLGLALRSRSRLVPAGTLAVLVILASTAYALAHEGHDHGAPAAPLPAGDAPRRLEDGTVFLPKPSQRLLEVRTTVTRPEAAQKAVTLVGRVIADPGRVGLVQSITGGRIVAPEEGLPRIGQAVKKGQVLALVEQPLAQADRTTISERVGEIEQQIAVAETRLRRARQLVERNVAPQTQVIDAEIELDGLRARREIVRQTRIEPEPLRAPVDGVVAAVRAVPGQVIATQDIAFQIVDPRGFWVEALAFGEVDPGRIADASAVAADGTPLTLAFKGFSKALQQQATLVQFSVAEPPSSLALGQPVRVVARSADAVTGIVLPRDAVVRGTNGEQLVWRHTDPERFEARPVRAEPFDATRVVVRAGLAPGERVVVRGAGLINQVR